MTQNENNYMEQVDAILRQRGFRPVEDRRLSPFVLYGKGSERLAVECRTVALYRAHDFRALIGDAILRFQALKAKDSDRLLLAVRFGRMGRGAKTDLREYADRFFPGLCWILASQDGPIHLRLSPGIDEAIAVEAPSASRVVPRGAVGVRSLFSPKSQWLWKSILLPGIGTKFWAGPDVSPGTVSELAEQSGVSQPVVSSFVGRAEAAGFIKRDGRRLVVVNHRELLEDWVHVAKNGRRQVIGVRSLYGNSSESELLGRIRDYCQKGSPPSAVQPIVVGHHLACHLLGLGHSNQRGAHLFVAAPSAAPIMDALELVPDATAAASLALIVDGLPDSIHRGCVLVDGVPVADVLQCYLDVRPSFARGREQADHIYERVLQPHFERV